MATEQEYKDAVNAVLPDVTFAPSIYIYSASVVAGDVISSSPPPNTLVEPDAVITLTVSLGPIPASLSRWGGAQDVVTGDPIKEIAAAKSIVNVVVFVDMDIPGDHVRVHSSIPTLKWGGHNWTGLGILGGIEAVSESLEVLAQPVRLTLSGVSPSLVSDIMNTLYHGSAVTLYVGLLDPDTYEFIDEPEELWSGYIDVMYIDVSRESSTIRVDCEHRLRRQPATSRYTDEDQRSHYAADRFFDKLHLIPSFTGRWGSRDTGYGGSAGGGSLGSGRGNREHHQQD